MHALWSLDRGAQLQPDNSVQFTLWAPNLSAPCVRILTGPSPSTIPLARLECDAPNDGLFRAHVPNVGANADYTFVIDDGRELPDPMSRWQPYGVQGPSRVVDPTAFPWTDDQWRGVALDELVIYELHVGTFTPESTFAAIIPRLAALKALGVSAIELMPIAQFPGDRNWGYDGVGLYAVQNSYGGPHALKALIDAAHATGLAVLLDVVYNHVGPEGNHLDAFAPYFTDRYTTPWGRAINSDGAHSDGVRRFVIDNARHWVAEYHVDGLRLDAIHGIFDFSTRHILEDIAEAVHTQSALMGKSVVVIAESDLNDPRIIRPVEDRGFGLDAQWADDFHHAVHAVLTNETAGYYADFGGVTRIADALREPFVYAGEFSQHRRRRHGVSSVGIPRRRFIAAIQNHDQIGNRATGDRLSRVVTPAQLRLAAALLILSPYIPLIFMGEEYGETNPFLYFISHQDEGLTEAVRAGRCREFESFGWSHDNVPDPAAAETFEISKIDWDRAAEPEHAAILALYRDLLALRRDETLLRPDAARLEVTNGVTNDDSGWIALLRERADDSIAPDGETVTAALALFNCSPDTVTVPIPESSVRAWTLRLFTDAAAYGGTATEVVGEWQLPVADEPKRLARSGRTVAMPAWSAACYTSTD
ncbi:MAG TPA: malto-oligosyltrehalose trehalohydrolase [Gemmatimonadaceae bacterium]